MYMNVYVCICTYMFVAYQCSHSLKRINNVVGWSKPCVGGGWPASQPVTVQPGHWVMGTAAGQLDMIMHSVPGPEAPNGGPADSSSLESQPVMVRLQLEVHSGPGHAGDGRGWIRCSQCKADSSSHYDSESGGGHSVPSGPGC